MLEAPSNLDFNHRKKNKKNSFQAFKSLPWVIIRMGTKLNIVMTKIPKVVLAENKISLNLIFFSLF